MTMGDQGVWQWPRIAQAPSMTFTLNQVISDPWLIKTLDSRTMKIKEPRFLIPKVKDPQTFRALDLGNPDALESHTFQN